MKFFWIRWIEPGCGCFLLVVFVTLIDERIPDVSVFILMDSAAIYIICMRKTHWEIVCWLWLLQFNNAIVIKSNFQHKFKPIIYT